MFKKILIPIEEYKRLINENHQLKEDLRYLRLNFHALYNIARNNIEGDDWLEELDMETEINRAIWEGNSFFEG